VSQPSALMVDLRDERWAQGLTQKTAALQAGIGEKTISNWEQGLNQPTLESVEIYLASLGLRLVVAPIEPDETEDADLGEQLPYGELVIGEGEKRCPCCRQIRSRSTEFHADLSRKDGLWRKCKHCRRDDRARLQQTPAREAAA
jgi:transcriptional regulator with XRE-family HTH domain